MEKRPSAGAKTVPAAHLNVGRHREPERTRLLLFGSLLLFCALEPASARRLEDQRIQDCDRSVEFANDKDAIRAEILDEFEDVDASKNRHEEGPSRALLSQRGEIDLETGHPDKKLYPLELLAAATRDLLATDSEDYLGAMNYGQEKGKRSLREALADMYNCEVDAIVSGSTPPLQSSDFFIVPGASFALSACVSNLPPGVVLVESPTYFLAPAVFESEGHRTVEVETDELGMTPAGLEAAIQRHSNASTVAVYIIPTYHNPTGRTMPPDRRRALAAICHQNDVLLISDEVYQFLSWGQPPPPPTFVCSPEARAVTVSVGSFSKTLGPGLRMGYVMTENEAVLNRLRYKGYIISGGGLCPFTGSVVEMALRRGGFSGHLAVLRESYGDKCRRLHKVLQDKLELGTLVNTSGGFYVWVEMPEVVERAKLEAALHEEGVRVKLYSLADGRCGARLCFAMSSAAQVEEGGRRFARALNKQHRVPTSLTD